MFLRGDFYKGDQTTLTYSFEDRSKVADADVTEEEGDKE